MARIIVTLQIMPESPDINLKEIENRTLILIKEFAGESETKIEILPIAFGLSAVKIIFIMDEKLGSTEKLEEKITKISGVNSVEVVDVRRCIG